MTIEIDHTKLPITDADLKKIEARHKQDDAWFTGGLHDPDGYVVMAHKDRAVMIKTLRYVIPREVKST